MGGVFMLQILEDKMQKYTVISTKLAKIAEDINNEKIRSRIQELTNRINNCEFYVIVIGQYKRGKSTFINYFLGDDILPTGVIPITSIITKIKYSHNPYALVEYIDGKEISIDLEDIVNYIAEEKNPQNIKEVKDITIYYPTEILKNGIVFIDTPGIASVHKHNTEVAYSYIKEADAAIFLISSDAPIGEIDIAFLKSVEEDLNKIFFVQNKVDYLKEEDKHKSADYSIKAIEESLSFTPDIFLVSAQMALDGVKNKDIRKIEKSGIIEFEKYLAEFLQKEKGQYLLQSYQNKLELAMRDLKDFVRFKIDVLNNPIAQLESRLETFKVNSIRIKGQQKEAMAIINLEIAKILESIDENLTTYIKEESREIKDKLADYLEESKATKVVIDEINSLLETEIENAYEKWNINNKARVKMSYEKLISKFTDQLNTCIKEINEITYEIFHTRMLEEVENFELIDKDTFYVKLGSSSPPLLLPKINSFLFLLPSKRRKGILLKKVLRRVDDELIKNKNNLKWDYQQKFNDSLFVFERAFSEHIYMALGLIEDTINRAKEIRKKECNSIQDELDLLRRNYKELDEINL